MYDVTNPETPLKVNVSGGKAYFPNDGRDHDFIVVNPERHYSVGDDATPYSQSESACGSGERM